MSDLKKEFQWYILHQADLVRQYNGKVLVIKDEKVFGIYGSEIEAYQQATKQFDLGTFLIQKCTPGDQDYSQTFRSRAVFH